MTSWEEQVQNMTDEEQAVELLRLEHEIHAMKKAMADLHGKSGALIEEMTYRELAGGKERVAEWRAIKRAAGISGEDDSRSLLNRVRAMIKFQG